MTASGKHAPQGQSLLRWLGRWLLWCMGMGLLAAALATGISTPADRGLYDWHLRHWPYPSDDQVVIVAIDPKSLASLGRWPWPRALHGQLLDRLTAAGVRGVGMDITVAEPDRNQPANDRALAAAVARNGRVVMPMFAEATELGGPLEEMLPIPAVATAAAALGQVDVAKDEDGVVRGAFLRAGLGQAHWPSLALALYQLAYPGSPRILPGLRDHTTEQTPYWWRRDDYVLLRYAGPAGSFGRLSYVDVLRGDLPQGLLKNRWVLIGATAEGLGDAIEVPMTGRDALMPGVEYQANVLSSLLRGELITPLDLGSQWLLGGVALALPLLMAGLPGLQRRPWLVGLAGAIASLTLALLLLRLGHRWWPPATCMALQLLGGLAASMVPRRQTALDPAPPRSHAAALQ